jgi:hypothetical protein
MKLKELPRNVLAASLTSFLMDISSEMVLNLVPSFWPMSLVRAGR